MNAMGILGYGQEFIVKSQCDGKEDPAGFDEVQSLDEKGLPEVNPYSGKVYEPIKYEFYVYIVESRVDSSD
jgi:hypothetical protein